MSAPERLSKTGLLVLIASRMRTKRRNCLAVKIGCIAAVGCVMATVGCTTVQTATPAATAVDRSAAGGALEHGDPAAPADKVVVAAADAPAARAGAESPPPPGKSSTNSAVANSSSIPTSSTAGISDARQRRLLEVAADFDHRRDEAQYQAALNRWREDDAAGCRETLIQLLNRSPNHCPARLLLADVQLSEGNSKAALEQARQVLAVEPQNAEAHHVMGLTLDALGETAAAISHYEQATRLDSQNEQYAACYHSAIDASVPPAAIPGEQNVSDRIVPRESVDGAQSVDPAGFAGGADRAASAAAANGVVQASAVSPIRADCDESPDARAAVARVVEAIEKDRVEDAVRIATDALAKHPRSALLYRVLGAAHYRAANYPAAQVAIAQALSLDKSDALAYFLMGSTLERLGQAEAAERQFAEAARLDPRFNRRD